MFGVFVKQKRIDCEVTLREFCLRTGRDPSNWSKIERGALPPPQEQDALDSIASDLGIEIGSSDWRQLCDLASAERGRIPTDLMSDQELVSSLPLFFRTLRGQKPTDEEMKRLSELIRRS